MYQPVGTGRDTVTGTGIEQSKYNCAMAVMDIYSLKSICWYKLILQVKKILIVFGVGYLF
jgi:hypothetical protein